MITDVINIANKRRIFLQDCDYILMNFEAEDIIASLEGVTLMPRDMTYLIGHVGSVDVAETLARILVGGKMPSVIDMSWDLMCSRMDARGPVISAIEDALRKGRVDAEFRVHLITEESFSASDPAAEMLLLTALARKLSKYEFEQSQFVRNRFGEAKPGVSDARVAAQLYGNAGSYYDAVDITVRLFKAATNMSAGYRVSQDRCIKILKEAAEINTDIATGAFRLLCNDPDTSEFAENMMDRMEAGMTGFRPQEEVRPKRPKM